MLLFGLLDGLLFGGKNGGKRGLLPLPPRLPKGPDEGIAIFISDVKIGNDSKEGSIKLLWLRLLLLTLVGDGVGETDWLDGKGEVSLRFTLWELLLLLWLFPAWTGDESVNKVGAMGTPLALRLTLPL